MQAPKSSINTFSITTTERSTIMDFRDNKSTNQAHASFLGKVPRSGMGAQNSEALGNATELHTPPIQVTDYLEESLKDGSRKMVLDKATGEFFLEGKLSEKESILEARKIRFDLQETASNVLYGYYQGGAPTTTKIINKQKKVFYVHHRTCTCTRFTNSNTTQILKSVDYGKAFFGGVMTCANSRTCPICAQKINERKSNEMRTAFNKATSNAYDEETKKRFNLYCTLLTFTAPHTAMDSLDSLMGTQHRDHYKTELDKEDIKKASKKVSKVVKLEADERDKKIENGTLVLDEILPRKKIKTVKTKDKKTGIMGAIESFWAGATATRFKEKYGIVGNIRSFEVRYGVNGWHPHFHIILFSKKQLPHTVREDGKPIDLNLQSKDWLDILGRWQSVCLNNGLNCPNEYGMDLQDGSQASSYITKFGSDGEFLETKSGKKITWDMADEMTKGNQKTGRKGSLSPWDLLEIISSGESRIMLAGKNKKMLSPEDAKLKFLEYARAMYRVTIVKWSRGLREFLDMCKEKTDAEILADEEDKADVLCHLTPFEWRFIYLMKHRAKVLELAELGGKKSVASFLYAELYIGSFEDYLHGFINRDKDFSDLYDNSLYGILQKKSDPNIRKFIKRKVKPIKDY